MKLLILLLLSTACFAQPKAVPIVTVNGTTATLKADSSTGNIGSYYWTVSPSVSFTNGVYYGGSNLAPLTATIKAGTRYTFILTVQDKGGNIGTAATVYDPAAPVIVKPPVPTPVPVRDTVEDISVHNKGVFFARVILWSDTTVTVIKK